MYSKPTDYDAVIFDMDGTLIDSMGMWHELDIEFLGSRNIEVDETVKQQIEGMSYHETAVFFKEHYALSESVEEIEAIWNQMAKNHYLHDIKLKDGVLELLNKLKSHGVPCGIATSNSRELADCCLKALGIYPYFRTVVTGNEIERGKPYPDIYYKAARNMNVTPERCLVFEDTVAGIKAGKNANMTVIAIYDHYSKDKDAQKRKISDGYIKDFYEIERVDI